MTDIAPAYAIAVDQLRARAEAAEKKRDALRAQLEAVTAERDSARAQVAELETGPCSEGCTPADAYKAVVTERDRLRVELATLRAMFHAAIDAAGRVP